MIFQNSWGAWCGDPAPGLSYISWEDAKEWIDEINWYEDDESVNDDQDDDDTQPDDGGSSGGSCDPSTWSDLKNTECDSECTALVNVEGNYSPATCTEYCAQQQGGLSCVGAREERSNDCNNIKEVLTCDTVVESSDTVCECSSGSSGGGSSNDDDGGNDG